MLQDTTTKKIENYISYLKLVKSGENFLSKHKPQIPKDLITFIRYTMKLSDNDYKILRRALPKTCIAKSA